MIPAPSDRITTTTVIEATTPAVLPPPRPLILFGSTINPDGVGGDDAPPHAKGANVGLEVGDCVVEIVGDGDGDGVGQAQLVPAERGNAQFGVRVQGSLHNLNACNAYESEILVEHNSTVYTSLVALVFKFCFPSKVLSSSLWNTSEVRVHVDREQARQGDIPSLRYIVNIRARWVVPWQLYARTVPHSPLALQYLRRKTIEADEIDRLSSCRMKLAMCKLNK